MQENPTRPARRGKAAAAAAAPPDAPPDASPNALVDALPNAVPAAAAKGFRTLARRDAALRRVLRDAGPPPWRTRSPGFAGLLAAITGQQISNRAAAAIWARISALPGACEPEGFLALEEETLRAAGFSRPKIAHGRAVAEAFASGVLATDRLAAMDDAAAIAAISAVRGLGVWSAEIYLLFALQRPDVFPAGDLALQASYAQLHGLQARPSARDLRAAVAGWAPYRGLGARLLWHWWRHCNGYPASDDA